LDHGEDPVAAVAREIQEELWCEAVITAQPLCTRVRKHKNGVYYFFVWYKVKIDLANFTPSDECAAYHFFDLSYLREHREQFHRLHAVIDQYESILGQYRKMVEQIQ
jgi:8-oxo-dGTP pyrophosphatase MutT (NUDIX family)